MRTQKPGAEFIGTFILVFFGCGSTVFLGDHIGFHGIAIAFGLSIVAAEYELGAISGAHLNPAVSLGLVAAGRIEMEMRLWVPSTTSLTMKVRRVIQASGLWIKTGVWVIGTHFSAGQRRDETG